MPAIREQCTEAAVGILYVEEIRQLTNHGTVDYVGHGEIAPPLLVVEQNAYDEGAEEAEHQGRDRALLHEAGNDLRRDNQECDEPGERDRYAKAEYVQHCARPDRDDVMPCQADDGGDQDAPRRLLAHPRFSADGRQCSSPPAVHCRGCPRRQPGAMALTADQQTVPSSHDPSFNPI
ncbi:hypothetical protein [Mesorhizobium sp. CO1-1-8]|uniref:hypothetical protein n=1 Tax=Mesorhizobium sp. CO1-1-8 TaxID=2876631 RepID=UPI001CD172D5|nr:hypothetical protein [Mesorhizobium sp. CO1-1-8]MBZ9775019.1 hypothetical protein [Mesorhizobium sp. CO1-1-8]